MVSVAYRCALNCRAIAMVQTVFCWPQTAVSLSGERTVVVLETKQVSLQIWRV